MSEKVDRDTRYFIDLDLQSGKILGWDCDNRFDLIAEDPVAPFIHRVYISKGQYNKLETKRLLFRNSAKGAR